MVSRLPHAWQIWRRCHYYLISFHQPTISNKNCALMEIVTIEYYLNIVFVRAWIQLLAVFQMWFEAKTLGTFNTLLLPFNRFVFSCGNEILVHLFGKKYADDFIKPNNRFWEFNFRPRKKLVVNLTLIGTYNCQLNEFCYKYRFQAEKFNEFHSFF